MIPRTDEERINTRRMAYPNKEGGTSKIISWEIMEMGVETMNHSDSGYVT